MHNIKQTCMHPIGPGALDPVRAWAPGRRVVRFSIESGDIVPVAKLPVSTVLEKAQHLE